MPQGARPAAQPGAERITLDASATAPWLLPDEATAQAEAFYADIRRGRVQVHAPDLWTYEVGNLLLTARRRGRLDAALHRQALERLALLQLELGGPTTTAELPLVDALALEHDLSFYDATYLHHALTLGHRLATLDRRLKAAAHALGVACLELA